MTTRRRAQQSFFAVFLLFTALWPLTNYVDSLPWPKFMVWAMYSRGLGEANRDPIFKLYFLDAPPQILPTQRRRPLVSVFTPDDKAYFRYFATTRAPEVLAEKLCADHRLAQSVGLSLEGQEERIYPCSH